MALPSGRLLTYPRPRWRDVDILDKDKKPTGEKRHELSFRRAHSRAKLWHGTLAENSTQAVAADILRATVKRIETNPALSWMPIRMTTHDEIVCEVDEVRADEAKAILRREMLTLPEWAAGLPMQSEESRMPLLLEKQSRASEVVATGAHNMATRSFCCGPCPTESARRRSSIRSTAARSTRLQYGNEGARQKARCKLPAMTDQYIEQCCREIARVLRPSGYLFLWADAFRLCRGDHLRVADVLPCVDLIAWNNGRFGMGYRSRRCGDYLLILQKPPIRAKATWHDHGIRDRWVEKVDTRIHPHIKPAGLIRRLIAAVTVPGDLIIDPAAGSFHRHGYRP